VNKQENELRLRRQEQQQQLISTKQPYICEGHAHVAEAAAAAALRITVQAAAALAIAAATVGSRLHPAHDGLLREEEGALRTLAAVALARVANVPLVRRTGRQAAVLPRNHLSGREEEKEGKKGKKGAR